MISLLEKARTALQNNDIHSALVNLNLAVHTLEGGRGGEQSNMTTTTEAGTIGSGGAGGAGTAGGIITGSGT